MLDHGIQKKELKIYQNTCICWLHLLGQPYQPKIGPEGAERLTESEHVELLLAGATCDVDGEEHWPGDAAADKAYHDRDFEETKEKIAIERIVL